MKTRLLKRPILIAAVTAVFAGLITIFGANYAVERASKNHVFASAEEVPTQRVGLVLGCVRYFNDGRENLFFRKRIERACELYNEGKVQYLLVSGDNSRKDYDEATDMRNALVELGVPDEAIYSDFAGFSTLDSVVRAKKVFGQTEFVVISQEFHVRRAIYIGRQNDMDVVGAPAEDIGGRYGIRTHLREYLARVKMVLDVHVFNRAPHFLGDPILVGESV